MKIIITLPSRLQETVAPRLLGIPVQSGEIVLFKTDEGEVFPPMQSGDSLLMLQPASFLAAHDAANVAHASGIHYGEISLLESPLAARYGFMAGVGGKAADLHILAPVLNALAPCAYGWWHVGEAGSAAFLLGLLKQLGGAMQNPIDLSNPLPQLAQLAALQQDTGQIAADYLQLTAGEHFISAMPDRQRPLATFLNGADSPARQIAQMICLFCMPAKSQTSCP